MKQAHVIDLLAYREQSKMSALLPEGACTDDLVTAIQNLIQRLREKNPIKQADNMSCY